MPAVDFHQHLWPDAVVRELTRRSRLPRLRGRILELPRGGEFEVDANAYSLEARLAQLDREELDVAVVSIPPTFELDDPDLLALCHEGLAEAVAAGGGRIRVLACGVCLDGFDGTVVCAASPPAPALYDELMLRGAVLFVHPGPTPQPPELPVWWAPVVGYTAQMQAAYAWWIAEGAARWPDLNVVFAILAGGAPIQLERLRSRGFDVRRALHNNLYFDTASYGRRALELSLQTFGVGRFVYGSDSPVIESGLTIAAVRGFGHSVEEALFRDNPSRLLP